MRRFIVLTLLCLPAAVRSQEAGVVSPGMTRAQVIAVLGAPTTQRTASEFTYMFYPNSCGRQCGMNDLVILKHDSVSDAIFRSTNRHYTGTSSSPQQATPALAPRRARPAAKAMTMPKSDSAAKTTAKAAAPANSKIKPPTKANDATPSIPEKRPQLQPAPAKSTTPAKPPATDKKTPG